MPSKIMVYDREVQVLQDAHKLELVVKSQQWQRVHAQPTKVRVPNSPGCPWLLVLVGPFFKRCISKVLLALGTGARSLGNLESNTDKWQINLVVILFQGCRLKVTITFHFLQTLMCLLFIIPQSDKILNLHVHRDFGYCVLQLSSQRSGT